MALVIGNSTYTDAPLRNPANDAQAMKTALESCKFEVTLLTNASKRTMEDAIRTFGNRIRNGAVGLFYFAGHGIQVEGSNFLIPVGARLDKESDVPYEGVDVGRVLDNMKAAGNKLNILILDACRNNPFALAKGWRSAGDKGLAQVKAPTGSLIAYATAPGSTAADGSGEHGLYTQALLEEIQEPGESLLSLFQKVRQRVLADSGRTQVPWESNSTVGDFYFHPLVTSITGPSAAQVEATYWEGLQDSKNAKDLEAFLAKFPNGNFAELAKAKLANLKLGSEQIVVNHLTEPWKALQRDELETKQEYAQRVAALGPLQVGTATVSVHNYDVDSGRLVLPIQADIWAKPYVKAGRVVLTLDRAQVRQLIAAGGKATVATIFAIQDGHPQSGSLTISTAEGSFTPSSEPPPVVGAVLNAVELWEKTVEVGRTTISLVQVPGGSFEMGESASPHQVTIKKDFWMGKFPVTQEQWQSVMGDNPSNFNSFFSRRPDAPVEQVSWDDAQSFVSKLNGTQTQWMFRLPTEAEWEYACRAGTAGETYGDLDAIAWYDVNSGNTTHPVGQKQPNAFGLYDMLGNVWQWCQDWFGEYSNASAVDPQGPMSGQCRVIRGGSWSSRATYVRSASRSNPAPNLRNYNLGFRVAAKARTIPPSFPTPVAAPAIEEKDGEAVAAIGGSSDAPGQAAKLGLTVEPLTPDLARSYGLTDKAGLLISGVDQGSPGAQVGLQQGDLIVEVNRRRVTRTSELQNAKAEWQEGLKQRVFLLLIKRKKASLFVALPLE